jgi:putative SOS response-associated peptidase YedK
MCGRYSLLCIDDLGNRFRVHNPMIGSRSRFNISPGTRQPAIVQGSGGRELVQMQWGLIPGHVSTSGTLRPVINARAETFTERPVFARLLASNRCLIPASGFFEWKQLRTKKIPYYFHMPDQPVFAFAGLFDTWRDPCGTILAAYTVVTTEPNPLVAQVHPRMPAILSRKNEERWLADVAVTAGSVRELLAPHPSGEMEMYLVPDLVNTPSLDDERVVRPLSSSAGTQTFLPE